MVDVKIFCICIVKNEADSIEYILRKASVWADKIIVLDNGSDDETWDIVNSIDNGVVVPWKSVSQPFHNGLRSLAFNEFKHLARAGDWWCHRLDADEIYVDNPRNFLTEVPSVYHAVYKKSIDYVIAEEDIEEFIFSGNFENDIENIRYFSPVAWSEGRFFRHRDRLSWDMTDPIPKRVGIAWKNTILVRHYQYRSPTQMRKRLEVRLEAKRNQTEGAERPVFTHVTENDWRAFLKPRKDLIFDSGRESLNLAMCTNIPRYSKIGYIYRRFMHGVGIWP